MNISYVAIQATDAWIAGKLGYRELAALTPPSMVLFVIVSGGYAFLSVITAFVSQALGRGAPLECGKYAWAGIYIAAAAGILSLFLLPCADVFEMLATSSDPELGALESDYFRLSLPSMIPVLIITAIANFYFGLRRPGIVLLASLFGFGLNLVLSVGLAFGRFGLPHLGFDGIAIGSVGATTAEMFLLGAFFVLSPRNSKFGTRRPHSSLASIRSIVSIGGPAGAQGAVDVLTWGVLLSALVSTYGAAELAAATILLRCMQLTFLPAEGVATVAISLVADAIGRGRPKVADEHAKIAFRINSIFMVGSGFAFLIFRYQIAGLFTDDPTVVALVANLMIFVTAAQWFDAMSLTYLHSLLGAGDTRWSNWANLLLSICILGVGGGLAVSFFRGAGVAVIWFLAWLYIASQGIAFWLRWRSKKWHSISL